jgi:hypothetical protein
MEPSASSARAKGACPAATATAEPIDDPPGVLEAGSLMDSTTISGALRIAEGSVAFHGFAPDVLRIDLTANPRKSTDLLLAPE